MLGPRFRFTTDFLTTRKIHAGTTDGDLVIRGRGDPTIVDHASLTLWKSYRGSDKAYNLPHGIELTLQDIAQRLRRRGLREVNGDIVIDDSYFDTKRIGDGWTVDDESWYYGAPTGAVSLNENIATITVRPNQTLASPPIIDVTPDCRLLRLTSEAVTGKFGTKNCLAFNKVSGKDEITVSGSLPIKHKRIIKFMAVTDPGLYMGEMMRNTLERLGIGVTGSVARKTIKGSLRFVLRTHSAPLESIVYWMNKTSDNFYAEQLVKTMGAVEGKDGSWDEGLKVVRKFLRTIGVTSSYRIADGSGLSRYNLITPRIIATLLCAMRNNNSFLNSLPVAGRDRGHGTLERRMRTTKASGNLRAKTGSLEGVSTLSGYVETLDGKRLVFSVMTNSTVGDLTAERRFQDRLGAVMASNSLVRLPVALGRTGQMLISPKTKR
jgi:PBP4 family serine-type D-alanyl-D-alanine carboxypeptidase